MKWNYERVKDPTKSHEFTRSTLLNLKEVLAPDTYTVVCKLEQPSTAFPADSGAPSTKGAGLRVAWMA